MSDVAGPGFGSGGTGCLGRTRRDAPCYRLLKRVFDLAVCVVLLGPPLLVLGVALVLLNPWLNRGPLFFVQERMGRGCRPFQTWKFRTMAPAGAAGGGRGAFDRLERERITPLGRWLRLSHLDELPQVLNVIRGEMSLVGPRPDALAHARVYLDHLPGYRERHAVLPGISGLAQTELGYVDGLDGLRAKVACDLHYVRHAGPMLDLRIAIRTVLAVTGGRGL